MSSTIESDSNSDYLIPWNIIVIVAFICAATLIVIAVMGPALLGIIQHRTSRSGIIQTIAFDITDLIVLTPLLLIGGTLQLVKKDNLKYFLVLTPITLMTVDLEYGLAQEWSITAYKGNVEAYSWLFLILVVGGLILLFGSLRAVSPGTHHLGQPYISKSRTTR